MSNAQGFFGQLGVSDDLSNAHTAHFYIKQALAQVRTAVPVKIVAVHGGGVAVPPTVDVQPLVKQMDGVGNSSSHSTIYGIPVARNQGGGSAVINDPVIGDIGHMVISDRDISGVKANSAEATPGSYRRHDLADGVYHGAIVNKTVPTTYINLNGGNVVIQSAGAVTINDSKGNTIIMNSNGLFVSPASGEDVYLGAKTVTGCFPVQTTGGTSTNVFAFV